jgi:large subunit ribosomal protein L23
MKDPHIIVIKPHITERSVQASYGDPLIKDEADVQRKYTFIVAPDANKIEIKRAIEAIYNEGKKKDEVIEVTQVRTITVKGKKRRVGARAGGYRPDRKKAIITLAKGQRLEDYGV